MYEVSKNVNGHRPAVQLLVVSRQPSSLGPLWSVAENEGWELVIAGSGCEALERVQAAIPDLVLLDADEGDADGLYTLRWLRRVRPELAILLLVQAADPQQRRQALRLGAREYLVKPIEASQLQALIESDCRPGAGKRGVRQAMASAASRSEISSPELGCVSVQALSDGMFFLAASPLMYKLRAQAELLAQVDVPLLITGESGSGKEMAARLIHQLSGRAAFGFHHLNCAALGGDLLERELLGYEPGAFPGAVRSRPGKLELAEKGTILLHDITAIPLPLQAKLLQVLQDREFFRLGGENGIAADVRIVASSSDNLEQAMAAKRLREDLYYRLSAFTLHLPPLRRRRGEIPLLLEHFMKRWALHYGLPARRFSARWVEACQAHPWPGNLRELESVVKRYLVMGDEELVLGELRRVRETPPEVLLAAGHGAGNGNRDGHGSEIQSPAEAEPQRMKQAFRGQALGKESWQKPAGQKDNWQKEILKGSSGLRSLVESVKGKAEVNAIRSALERTRWNRKAAARLLRVSYRTLLYKIQQYRMTPPGMFPEASPSSGAASSVQAGVSEFKGKRP